MTKIDISVVPGSKCLYKEDWQNAMRLLDVWPDAWGSNVMGRPLSQMKVSPDMPKFLAECG